MQSCKVSLPKSLNGPGRIAYLSALLLFAWASVCTATEPIDNAWEPSASLAVKEGYDDNVYLENVGPRANRGSFLTTIVPNIGLGYHPAEKFAGSLTYAPEMNLYHSEPGENFTTHRVLLSAVARAKNAKLEMINNFAAVEGSDTGAIYPTTGGGATAGGGPQAMLRRDMFVERGVTRLTQNFGDFFARPTLSGFLYDYRIRKDPTPGYQNLVDRNELAAGSDVGYSIGNNTAVVTGYRYGIQNQAQLFPERNPAHFDSTFHRALVGVEGSPSEWAQLNLSVGPEFRTYDGILNPGTDKHQNFLYADATVTLLPTKSDVVNLSAKRFQQPGFAGCGAYTDSTFEGSWKHRFGDKFALGIGARAYNLDFIRPTLRNDWIYTACGSVSYTFAKDWNAEATYSHDIAESWFPNTPAREYTRNLVALGLRYVFK